MTDTIDMFSGSGGLPAPRKPQEVLSFGKHKGQPFEVLLQDSGYALWLMNSMFAKLQTNHPELLAFLITRYGLPDRTPVHNKLQNKFLDQEFCLQFAVAGSAGVRSALAALAARVVDVEAAWTKRVQATVQGWPDFSGMAKRMKGFPSIEQQLHKARDALLHEAEHIQVFGCSDDKTLCAQPGIGRLEIEVEGADVRFTLSMEYAVEAELHPSKREYNGLHTGTLEHFSFSETFRIEVKPVLGDDYPAVLRTMKATNCTHLLVDEYCGDGATWEQVVKVFALSKMTAVLLADVQVVDASEKLRGVPVKPLDPVKARDIVMQAYQVVLTRLVQ
jgi:hypothetical protein